MNLKTYISDSSRKQALAAALNTSIEYLWQLSVAWRGKKPSPALARRIRDATAGEVSLHELRPDVWPVDEQRAT